MAQWDKDRAVITHSEELKQRKHGQNSVMNISIMGKKKLAKSITRKFGK